MQKPIVEADVYDNNKKCEWGGKNKFKSLTGFLTVNKIDNYNRKGSGGAKKKKEKKIQKNLQSKSKNKINAFLESLLSESFPTLGVTVHLTSLGCPPTLC